ncbi:unnamed protein product, partial [Durusdinium trenchii]
SWRKPLAGVTCPIMPTMRGPMRWWSVLVAFLLGAQAGAVLDDRSLGSMPKETEAVFKLAAKKADKAAMQDAKKECLRDLPQASEWSDTKRQLCCDMMGLGCEKPVVVRTEDKEDQEEADDDSQAVVFRLQDETIPVNEPFQLPLKVAVTTDANTKLTTSATLESGDPLPSWMSLKESDKSNFGDAEPFYLSGTPPELGTSKLKIQTIDDQGRVWDIVRFNLEVVDQVRPSQAALTAATPVADRSGTLVASELPDGQGHVGESFSYEVPPNTFTDSSGSSLMLSASPLPAWLTFDGQVLRGIPLEQGEIQLQVKATNNVGRSQSVPLRINVGDGDAKEGAKSLLDTADIQSKTGPTASALPDASGKVGDLFSYEVPKGSFVDPTGGQLTLSVKPLPAWLTFDGLKLNGAPTAPSELNLEVKATNANGLSTSVPLHVTVVEKPSSASVGSGSAASSSKPVAVQAAAQPVLQQQMDVVTAASLPDGHAPVGYPFEYTIPATTFVDHHGGGLKLQASGLPSWLSFDGKTLTGTAPQKGVVDLEIVAKNKLGLTDKAPLRIHMDDTEGSGEGSESKDEAGSESGSESKDEAGSESGSESEDEAGSGSGDAGPQTLSVVSRYPKVVENVNEPFDHVLPKTWFADPESGHSHWRIGDKIDFSFTLEHGDPLPEWLSFKQDFVDGANKLTMSGTCPKVQAIWLEVKATVPSESIAMVFELDCVAKGPFVNQILPDASGTVGQEIQQQIPEETIQDPDGKPVAYAVSLMDGGQLPEWLHFDPETETLSGTPSAAQELHLLVEGKDEQGLTAQTSWKLKVGPSGPAPKAKAQPLVAQHLPLWEGTVGEKMVRQVPEGVVSDPLGSQLHFSAHGEHGTLPHWMSFDPKSMTFSGVPDKALSMTVYVKGATKEGLSARSRMKVVVGTPSVNKLAKEMTAVAEEDKLIVPTLPPPEYCTEMDVMYEPIDMNMSDAANGAKTVVDCMLQCRNMKTCAHFTFFFPLKQCHFSSSMATRQTGRIGFVAGGALCAPSQEHPEASAMVGIKKESVEDEFDTQHCGVPGLTFTPLNPSGRTSSYKDDGLACQKECQSSSFCHSYVYNTLTKACDLQDHNAQPTWGNSFEMAGPVFCDVDVKFKFTAVQRRADRISENTTVLKAALKAALVIAAGDMPVYTEKSHPGHPDGSGTNPERYRPALNPKQIHVADAGESDNEINFTVRVRTKRSQTDLYVYNLVKGEKGTFIDAIRDLTAKTADRMDLHLPRFYLTDQRMVIAGDHWASEMKAKMKASEEQTGVPLPGIPFKDLPQLKAESTGVQFSQGSSILMISLCCLGGLALVLGLLVASQRHAYTAVGGRARSRPGMDALLE